jgi:hypothetical protein
MRYHPLYEGFWSEPKLEGCPLEEYAFAAYLFSNLRVRPSGIYVVTDLQVAADLRLPVKRVGTYFTDLDRRHFIVRDRAWLFVVGYLARQPKQPFLMRGAEVDVKRCESKRVVTAFGEQYPLLKQWSVNGLATIAKRSGNHLVTTTVGGSEQRDANADADAEERSANHRLTVAPGSASATAASPGPLAASPRFRINAVITEALDKCPILGRIALLRDPAWWQAEIRANNARGVDYVAEIVKAEAWLRTNPDRAPKTRHARFFHAWLARANS